MAEDFWWKKAGRFYGLARQSKFVTDVHEAFLERVQKLPAPSAKHVLDAGCGDGNATLPIAKMGHHVVGVDFGHSVLEQGRLRAKRLHVDGVEFRYHDLNEPLHFADSSFELVTSLHAIMKVENFPLALQEFFRVTKPGGHLVISTTSSDESFSSWFFRYAKKRGLARALWDVRWLVAWGLPYVLLTTKKDRRDEWRWPKQEFQRILESVGYRTISVEEVPYTHVGCVLGVFEKPHVTASPS